MDTGKTVTSSASENPSNNLSYKLKSGLFLFLAAGIGLFSGFGGAITSIKKKDPKSFAEGIVVKKESGVAFAARALAYGSLLSICGTGIFFWGIWKVSGAHDFEDFKQKVGQVLPRVTKKTPPKV
ncbi:transmembrane protein 242 [Lepeophtheirus salmonis]|uniref:transmembrane protein 242 n=1 Tax=Lepeophtheirus salmonis TaxID=72036 RepID=UPI003AF3DF6B